MGDSGGDVRDLQQALTDKGYFVGSVDGQYGRKTTAAVGYLQSCHGLDIDGVAGPQVYEAVGLENVSVSVEVKWPDIDVVVNGQPNQFTADVSSLDNSDFQVRVVVWFRGPAGEEHAEETVSGSGGAHALTHITIPQQAVSHEGEIHWSGLVFDMQGRDLATETGSFRVDLPEQVT